MRTGEREATTRTRTFANHANFANSMNSAAFIASGIRSVKLKLEFVDIQGLDAGLESRWRDSESSLLPLMVQKPDP